MGRYIQDVNINQPIDVVSMTMEDYIYHNRYIRTDWNGEPVYQCIDASGKDRYLKWSYVNGTLHLEAWIKGVFGEEADLNGIGKEKKEYKDSIEKLIVKLRTHSGTYTQPKGAPEQPTYTSSWMGSGRSFTSSYAPAGNPSTGGNTILYGILAIVFCFMSPIVGLIFAILGKSRYKAALRENPDNSTAKTGAILCKIALVVVIVMLGISFIGLFLISTLTLFAASI